MTSSAHALPLLACPFLAIHGSLEVFPMASMPLWVAHIIIVIMATLGSMVAYELVEAFCPQRRETS